MELNKVHLIRHGHSQANMDQLVCGQLDSPLSKQGVLEIKQASASLDIKKLTHLPCFCSPLIRARDTANLLGFENIIIRDNLMETNTGDYSEKRFSEVTKINPEFDHFMTNLDAIYPKGESTRNMLDRVWYFFLNDPDVQKLDEIVIVAHGGPLNSIVGNLLGASFKNFPSFAFENNKITTLVKSSEKSEFWSLLRMNVI
jgi:broad specificity phosphatase PhoE